MSNKDDSYKVGDLVQVQMSGKWYDAKITKMPHPETGNYYVRLKVGTTVINTVSAPAKIKPR